MKAARYHGERNRLRIDDVETPPLRHGDILVKIAGSGLCHSDLRILNGQEDPRALFGATLPLTLGHENAGYVEQVGSGVEGFTPGDPVAVYGGWGCGRCWICRAGEEQQCDLTRWVGVGCDGGYAQYLRVPASRHLIKLSGLDPLEAAPLVDAGLSPYRAIKKTLPLLSPGYALVIVGVGGLGHLAVQIAKAIAPAAVVIAVDIVDEKSQLASELGAQHAVDGRGDAVSEIMRLTQGEGARAVIDLVGSDSTLRMVTAIVGRGGLIVLTGGAGGRLEYSWSFAAASITSTAWGSPSELEEVLALAESGMIRPRTRRLPLDEINEAFGLLESGALLGRGVVTPHTAL